MDGDSVRDLLARNLADAELAYQEATGMLWILRGTLGREHDELTSQQLEQAVEVAELAVERTTRLRASLAEALVAAGGTKEVVDEVRNTASSRDDLLALRRGTSRHL
jgi:hypothetical protein